MLHTLHHQILPCENALPDSYDEAMKLVKDFLITPIVHHCCPNDCMVFSGDLADLSAIKAWVRALYSLIRVIKITKRP